MLSKSEPIEANTSTTIATAAAANNNNFNLSNTANKSRATQQLLNNGTPPRQEQKQEPYLKATLAGQQATGNETKHPTNDNKIWLYFERSQNDANKLKCLLCATELCNQLNTDLHQDSSTHSVLWNHLRVKHAISRDINNSSSERRRRRQAFNDTKQHNSRINKSALNTANNSHKINDTISIRTTTTTTTTTTTINNNTSPSTGTAASTTNMTNIKNHQRLNSSANTKKLSSSNHDINDLRRNLDLFEYGDLSKASLKPLPSSSLSRNLFERLNQLSSPVTRKLKFWNKKSFQVNQYDPCFKVIYLGNLGVQFWSKDESCLEKPLNTLWNNYLVNMKTEIVMRLTICNSGLKAITRQHGLTQYWSNRLVYCCSHKNYPKIFSWIYRHEGKKMRQELRCHAVFCSSPERASKMVSLLNQRLTSALEEFKREKKSRGQSPSITSNCNSLSSSSSSSAALLQTTLPRTVPLRRQILAKGSANFRPPLERSKSAPKLTSINEEDCELEEDEEDNNIEEEEDEYVASRQFNGDNNDTVNDNGDHISQDELEYEQSFDDRDDDDDDDDSNSDYNDDELGKHDDGDSSTHKVESIEEFSNSSVYATGDISYDNIVAHRHQLSANHERLDNESTLTAPIILKSSSSLRRSSLRSSSLNQNESLNSDPTESMSDGGQHELDSQLASTASSTLNSTCHINNTNNNTSTPEHENGVVAESNHDHHQNTVAHYFGQIKL